MRLVRAGITLLASAGSAAISVSIAVFATPWLLDLLGEERFGLYRVSGDAIGYLQLLEFGLGAATLPVFVRLRASDDHVRGAAAFRNAVNVFTMIGIATLLVGLALAFVLPLFLPIAPELRSELSWGLAFSAASALSMPLTPYRSLLESLQRGYIVHWAILVQSIATVALMLLSCMLGYGLVGVFASSAICTTVFSGVLTIFGRSVWPELWRQDPPSASIMQEARLSLWRLSWPLFAHQLCGRMNLLSDNLIVGCLIHPVVVVGFDLTQRLPKLLAGQLLSMGAAAWPGLLELHSRGDARQFSSRFADITQLIAVVGWSLMMPTALLMRAFVTLWVGPTLYAGDALAILACVNGWLLAIASFWYYVVAGGGCFDKVMPLITIQTAINVTISVVGALTLGPIGPIVGTFVASVATNWYLLVVIRRELGADVWPAARRLAGPTVTAIILGGLSWVIPWKYPIESWLMLAFCWTAMLAIYLASVACFVFKPAEREMWVSIAYRFAADAFMRRRST